MLKKMGFSLQANSKQKEGSEHRDRDAQFEYIKSLVDARKCDGNPVVSVDTKKKETVGDFKNGGRELRPKGDPERVRVHDFVDKEKGKVNPYGVYDIARNHGFVSLGISADTAEFAVGALRKWWSAAGLPNYPDAKSFLVTADGGGSNGYRVRLWKWCLQQLANELSIPITVAHYPPGTSKWNPIEHRQFAQISMNWRGKPLYDIATIIGLISSTRTRTGLTIECHLDQKTYRTGIRITKKDMRTLNIKPNSEFHPEWNYTIIPTPKSVRQEPNQGFRSLQS